MALRRHRSIYTILIITGKGHDGETGGDYEDKTDCEAEEAFI